MLAKIIDDYKDRIASKKQTVETDIPPKLPKFLLDPKLVEEAFANLISNANKYTPEGGRIWIRVKTDGSSFTLSVADNGIGIPINDQRRIFEKLFRASNAGSGVTDGNGLGLYFVKWVAESHGGRIWFKSEEGIGTTFYLMFPLKPKS